MARISYVQESTHPELAPVIQTIREQRRGKLIPVYGLLLRGTKSFHGTRHTLSTC